MKTEAEQKMGEKVIEIRPSENNMQNTKCRGDFLSGTDLISLYVHIPFCLRKCRYCDFLSAPQTDIDRERYVKALIREIKTQKDCPAGRPVDTVFFGGGTPSVLSADQIGRIIDALREVFLILPDAEVSLETNPGTADFEKLSAFKEAGINRLSMGVQSMHDEELHLLGRIHTAEQALEAFKTARAAGFDNINIDLMSALPGQTFDSWADSLRQAVEWRPEHISAYSLIIEPGTPFSALYEAGELPPLPDEETDRKMYHYTREYLAQHGYGRYEISNYALSGRECRHNSGYWTGHPYLGLGIGAASYVNGARFSNITDFETYIEEMDKICMPEKEKKSLPGPGFSPEGERTAQKDIKYSNSHENLECNMNQLCGKIRTQIHLLTEREKMEEFMFLGLRMTAGVKTSDFASRFGKSLDEVYGDVIRRHLAQGLLQRTPEGFCLTERGTDVSNYVMADYLQ